MAGAAASKSAARSRAASPAYVLHSHDWSESSLILDLFTRDHGRVVAVAKGAKRPYSQLRSVLLPFQRIDVAFGARQGAEVEVWLLRLAEWGGGPAWPGGDALLPGFYANELLMRLLPRLDPLPRLWDAYADLLPALTQAGAMQAALRAFELVLLRQLGHLPELLVHSTTGQPLLPHVRYTLHPELGLGEAASDEAALTGQAWCQIEAGLNGGARQALLLACQPAGADLRLLMRSILLHHAGPQPLRTRQLMADLMQVA